MRTDLYNTVQWGECDLLTVPVELHKGVRLVRYGGGHDADAFSIDEEKEAAFEFRAAHHTHLLTDLRKGNGRCGVGGGRGN